MKFFTLLIFIILPSQSFAAVCKTWSTPQKVGALDSLLLPEASGLVLSRSFPNRFYHHNDSGDGPFFYITDTVGKNTQKVELNKPIPTDIEDIAVGPCAEGQCIFLGDIGDNFTKRDHINVWIVPERENFPTKVSAYTLKLKYPDHPHNAEAMAVDPQNGDLYILTKEEGTGTEAQAAQLFRAATQQLDATDAITLQYVNSIDIPAINNTYDKWGQIATAMDISPDGQKLIILTYENMLEVDWQKALSHQSRDWILGQDFNVLPLQGFVSQQEAIAYGSDGKSFYFESEFNPDAGDTESPLYRVDCLN